jgi:hypothetical protein
MISKSGEIKNQDWKKLAIGLLIGLGGAALTYLQDAIPTIDFGQYTGIVVALNSLLINFFRKLLSETKY